MCWRLESRQWRRGGLQRRVPEDLRKTWLTGVNRTHNDLARTENRQADCADYVLIPLHDERNIPVAGFPRQYEGLLKPEHCKRVPVYQAVSG